MTNMTNMTNITNILEKVREDLTAIIDELEGVYETLIDVSTARYYISKALKQIKDNPTLDELEAEEIFGEDDFTDEPTLN